MNRMPVVAAVMAAGAGLLVTAPARAQSDPALPVDVADCVELESPAERFRCYESRVDAALREQGGQEREPAQGAGPESARSPARAGQGAQAPVQAGRPAPSAAEAAQGSAAAARAGGDARAEAVVPEREIDVRGAASADDDFGLRAPEERETRAEEPTRELFGTVAELRETVPNSYLITLENGQVWRQMRPKWYPIQVGNRVRIYSTKWGNSYRMTVEELNGFIQVERVR